MNSIYTQSICMWFVFMTVAIINGIARNSLYQNRMSELSAHQISSITGIILFSLIIYFFLKLTKTKYTARKLLNVGIVWLAMTITFEFLFGHYVAGHSWQKLLHDYNVLEGRLWILVLMTIFIGPWIIGNLILKRTE